MAVEKELKNGFGVEFDGKTRNFVKIFGQIPEKTCKCRCILRFSVVNYLV